MTVRNYKICTRTFQVAMQLHFHRQERTCLLNFLLESQNHQVIFICPFECFVVNIKGAQAVFPPLDITAGFLKPWGNTPAFLSNKSFLWQLILMTLMRNQRCQLYSREDVLRLHLRMLTQKRWVINYSHSPLLKTEILSVVFFQVAPPPVLQKSHSVQVCGFEVCITVPFLPLVRGETCFGLNHPFNT